MRDKTVLTIIIVAFVVLALVFTCLVLYKYTDVRLTIGNSSGKDNSALVNDSWSAESIGIGENGNLYINGMDTGYSAGPSGGSGEKDESTVFIGENGNWFVNGIDTGISAQGISGKDGSDGKDGSTPYIGENGNWFVGDIDTGVSASGSDGKDGSTPYIGENGNWWIGDTDTGYCAIGQDGKDGSDGTDGTNGNDGLDGTDGETPYIKDGYWWIGGENLGIRAEGVNGIDGADGNGILAMKVQNGCLYVRYTNAPDIWVNLGAIESEITHTLAYYPLPDGTYGVKAGELLYMDAITVPREYNGAAVTQILPDAFSGAQNLVSITIPTTVTEIGDGAFSDCKKLESVFIPNTVVKLGENVFSGSAALSRICLEAESVPEGWRAAFNPDGIPLHLGCKGKGGASEDGFEYEETASGEIAIVGYMGGEAFLTVPQQIDGKSVSSIASGAFAQNSDLLRITVPEAITKIEAGAFDGCYKLYEIYNLSSLSLSVGGEENGGIAKYAKVIHTDTSEESILYETADGFVFVNIDGSAQLLAYNGVASALVLPESYESKSYKISSYAFYNRADITSVTVSSGVSGIGKLAFAGCSSVTDIYFDASDCGAAGSGDNIFALLGSGTAGTTLTVGSGVTKIPSYLFASDNAEESGNIYTVIFEDGSVCSYVDNYAFYNVSALERIVIPDSVTRIGACAFRGCEKLTYAEINTKTWYLADSPIALSDPNTAAGYLQSSNGDFIRR